MRSCFKFGPARFWNTLSFEDGFWGVFRAQIDHARDCPEIGRFRDSKDVAYDARVRSRSMRHSSPARTGRSERPLHPARRHETRARRPARVHIVASLLKRWLQGTLRYAASKDHLAYYLDEFTFRFTRHSAKNRGLLFHRLMSQAVNTEPHPLPS